VGSILIVAADDVEAASNPFALFRSKEAHISYASAITPRGTPTPAPIAVLWHEPFVHDLESAIVVFAAVSLFGEEPMIASSVEIFASIA
jgi:hypothetical protein